MDILLRHVTVIDPSSPFHQQQVSILIQNGVITEIGALDVNADQVISQEGLCVSPGWVDVFSNFCDPGYEFRETLESGSRAAAAGGYTDVMVIPNTNPVLHNKSGIEYIVQMSRYLPATVHPIGAITRNTEGKELSEMYDMHQSGAVAFSDGTNPIQTSGILVKALQYLKAIDKVVIQVPDDKAISTPGLMNEGIVSTRLGLPGKPAIAEELTVNRDIELAEYTGSRIHFTGISTARSVALIREARAKGVSVTCSVTPYHLFFTDEALTDYDTNFKVNPPLRTSADRDALRAAVQDGTVDCIATHHMPQDKDNKVVEFEYAKYGMTGLETSFACIRTLFPDMAPEQLLNLFCTNARKIFDLPAYSVEKGKHATLSLYAPNAVWTYTKTVSKSVNSPFLGKQLTGKPVGIINREKVFLTP